MNAIAVALTAALVTAGAAFAHGTLTADTQPAGVLTCTTRPELSLVFGRTPVVACTFLSDRGATETYAALLTPQRRPREVRGAETMIWSVLTPDGMARPSMIRGTFRALADQPDIVTVPGPDGSRAAAVSLKLLSHSGQQVATFALANPRIAFEAEATRR